MKSSNNSALLLQIDLEELICALRQDRAAKTVLNKEKGKGDRKGTRGLEQRPEPEQKSPGSSDNLVGDGHEKSKESAEENVSTAKESRPDSPVGAEEIEGVVEGGGTSPRTEGMVDETTATEQGRKPQDDKDGKPLFSPGEAKSLTAFLVESQQAFSLVNVADIQRGEPDGGRLDPRTAVGLSENYGELMYVFEFVVRSVSSRRWQPHLAVLSRAIRR